MRASLQAQLSLGALLVSLTILGCGSTEPTDPAATTEGATTAEQQNLFRDPEALTTTTDSGPVSATLSIAPAEPVLGDVITLTLSVEAQPQVAVSLPDFGEALGRFSIVDYTPTDEVRPDGTRLASQRYRLQSPMSGRQRIPPLRVTFRDLRPNSVDVDIEHELLTEEVRLLIGSVLDDEEAAVATLRPARLSLPPRPVAASSSKLWLILFFVVVLGSVALGVLALRMAARQHRRRTAYDVAISRLKRLRSRGMPSGEDVDQWYVDLSDIVRRYLEDQFMLRAPELTTEEFLQIAKHSTELTQAHRDMLSGFLLHCDRVKFAGYEPDADESERTLESAGDFLAQTRLVDERTRLQRTAPA